MSINPMRLRVKLLQSVVRYKTMDKRAIFYHFTKAIERGAGIKRTPLEEAICRRALARFKRGSLGLEDCYKKPSFAKISAYLECESLAEDCGVEQVCSSVIGYNCDTFSWGAVWVDKTPDNDGHITIYLRYDTAWHRRLIEVCRVPYELVK